MTAATASPMMMPGVSLRIPQRRRPSVREFAVRSAQSSPAQRAMEKDKPHPPPRFSHARRSSSPPAPFGDRHSATHQTTTAMYGWPHEQHTTGFCHGLHDMALPPPMGMGASHALDQDALLEALVFMDDLDLDANGDVAAAIKHEPPPQTMRMGPFTGELESFGVIPAEVYAPGMFSMPTLGPSMIDSGGQDKKEVTTASMPPSPSPSPSPSSPPASTSSASPPVSPSAVSETKSTASSSKPKGVVNRSRNRRREELNYLRSLVGELEDRLTTLRKRADEQQEHEHNTHGRDATAADDPVLTAVWEDLATRQYAQRQRAEVENNKLRRMLEDQIQVGKSLERLLKKRSNATDDVDVTLHGKRPRRSSVSSAWNNAAIFDELLANLPGMYNELATVYSKLNFDRTPTNFRDISVRNDTAMGVILEVTEARIFPFDYALTTQEFWTLFVNPTEGERFHYHDMDCGEDVLKVQFGMTVQVARAQGEFNMKIVSRRYVEAHRTVILWAALCDPTEISETNMDGVYMRHRGWNIIEPLTSSSSGASGTTGMGTRTTSYSYAVPEAFADVPDQKRKVGTLTNFMLSTADMQINARQQQLENRLVELSRER